MVTYLFFENLSLALNFCLCHDLIQTFKNPFYPGKRRLKWYLALSLLFAILYAFLDYFSFKGIIRVTLIRFIELCEKEKINDKSIDTPL